MRSPLFLLTLLLVLVACNTTERIVHFSNDPLPGVQLATEDINALRSKYGAVDGVYLNYDQTLEHNVSIAFTSTIPNWKFYRIVDRSYAVFNTSSQDLTSFRLELGPNDNLEQASITVQAPGVSGSTYQKDDLRVQTGSDGQKIYTLPYSVSQPGTIIYEKFEVTQGDLEKDPPVSHDVPLQYNIPAERINFQYVYPIWWQVDVKQLSLNQPLDYRRIEDPDRRKIILNYTSDNVPAFVEGPNGPYFKQAAPYFQLQVTDLSMGSALRYRAPEDWTDFAREYRQYAVGSNARRSRSVQRTADNLVGPASSDLERVETILNYIKDNIIVRDDIRQRSFDMALSRREADPFMVTGLMQSMLYAANIDSEYLLIHPAYEGYFDPDFFSSDQFEIPALGVLIEGEQYYVLPGRQRSLSEKLPSYFGGQTAMVITPEGFGGFTEIFSGQISPPDMVASAGDNMPAPAVEQPVQTALNPNNTTVTNPEPLPEPVTTQPVTTQPTITDPQPADPGTATNANSASLPGSGNVAGITQPVSATVGNAIGDVVDQPVDSPAPQPVDPAVPEWEGSIKAGLGGYSWVVASRTTIEEARDLANQYAALYQAGISIDVLRGESRGVVRYRIAIGQYTSRTLAEDDRATRLRTVLPGDAWLLRVEPNM